MSTLTEIEIAVDRLSPEEQEKLPRRLETALRRTRKAKSESRNEWMRRLDALRVSLVTGTSVQPSEQILEDLRGG